MQTFTRGYLPYMFGLFLRPIRNREYPHNQFIWPNIWYVYVPPVLDPEIPIDELERTEMVAFRTPRTPEMVTFRSDATPLWIWIWLILVGGFNQPL